MDIVISIFALVVGETVPYFCCCTCSGIKNTVRIQKNPDDLEREMKNLMEVRNGFQQQLVSADQKDGKAPTQVEELWLREVEELERKVGLMQAGMVVNKKKKLCGCLFDCRKRCRATREVARLLREVEALVFKAVSFPEAKTNEHQGSRF